MNQAADDFVVQVFRAGFLPADYRVVAIDATALFAHADMGAVVQKWEASPLVFGWYLPGEGSLLPMRGDHTAVLRFGSVLPLRGMWAVLAGSRYAEMASDVFGAEHEAFNSYGRARALRLMVLATAQALAADLEETFYGEERQAARPHIEALIAMGDPPNVSEAVSEAVEYLTSLPRVRHHHLERIAQLAGSHVLDTID